MFHVGHLECLRKCRKLADNPHLIVGIVSDKDAESYKRKPTIEHNYPDKILFETTWHNTEIEKNYIINKYESIGYKSKNYDESNTLLILDVDKVKKI